MCSDLLDVGAEGSVVSEKALDKILELRREMLALNLRPIFLVLPGREEVVEIFLFAGLLEGEDASDQDE